MRRVPADLGSALLEVLLVGALVCVVLVQILLGAGAMLAAREVAAAAAERAATWTARYGTAQEAPGIVREILPEAAVAVTEHGERITVEVRTSVDVAGLVGVPYAEVAATRTAEIPPLRSGR